MNAKVNMTVLMLLAGTGLSSYFSRVPIDVTSPHATDSYRLAKKNNKAVLTRNTAPYVQWSCSPSGICPGSPAWNARDSRPLTRTPSGYALDGSTALCPHPLDSRSVPLARTRQISSKNSSVASFWLRKCLHD